MTECFMTSWSWGWEITRLESASSCKTSMTPSWIILVETIIEEDVGEIDVDVNRATGVGVRVILVKTSVPVVNLMTTPSTVVRYSIDPGTISVGRKIDWEASMGGSSAGWGGRWSLLWRLLSDIWQFTHEITIKKMQITCIINKAVISLLWCMVIRMQDSHGSWLPVDSYHLSWKLVKRTSQKNKFLGWDGVWRCND